MSVRNFVPTIWSREILFTLKKNLIGLNIVNRNYEGDITGQGDTVKITTPSAITVHNYTGSDFSFDEVLSTQQQLEIDQAKAFHFQVDDVDAVQANINLITAYTQEAAHALAKAADTFIFQAYAEAAAANVIDSGGFTSSNAYSQLTEASKRLSEANVPETGRWAVLDPAGFKALSNDTAFQKASDLGDQVSREGFMGRAAGFDVWMSNNLAVSGGKKHYLYGHNIGITFADQLLSTEAGRREKAFKDFVKGLHVYGKKVIRPTAIGTIEVDAPGS